MARGRKKNDNNVNNDIDDSNVEDSIIDLSIGVESNDGVENNRQCR